MVGEKKQQFVAERAAPLTFLQHVASLGFVRVLSAPVSAPDFSELRHDWLRDDLNQNLGPTDPTSVRFTYVTCFEPHALLSERGLLLERTVAQGHDISLAGEVTVVITRARTVDGFALLCEGDLGPSPAPRSIPGPSEVFLPISTPFDVRPGDRLTLNFHQPGDTRSSEYIARWSGGVDWDARRTFHLKL